MPRPIRDPTDRSTYRSVSWTNVVLTYALAALIPVLLWAVSAPAAGVALAVGAAAAAIATRHARRLARCFEQCRGLAFDLPRAGRVTVCWDDTCGAA